MTPSFQVRWLQGDDIATLRAMLAMFGRAFEDLETYGGEPPGDAYLKALLARDTFVAVAAFEGPSVIGGLAGYVLPKFEQARSEFYIYDLAVDEAYRRRGVATALIEGLKGLAAERGIYVIFVQADHETIRRSPCTASSGCGRTCCTSTSRRRRAPRTPSPTAEPARRSGPASAGRQSDEARSGRASPVPRGTRYLVAGARFELATFGL